MSLYDAIGAERVQKILSTFYTRCFEDVMIGHFFFEKNHGELLTQQIAFATGMLGGPVAYSGRPLLSIHKPLQIRTPQFMRRQRILVETMEEYGLEKNLCEAWLALEDKLRPIIIRDSSDCRL